MVDETRKEEMRKYQQERSAARRRHGLVTRTFWIAQADNDAFRTAVAPFVDRARLIEAILKIAPLPAPELVKMIKTHNFPYDPEDIVYLATLGTTLALKPMERAGIERKAREILAKYDLPIAVEDIAE